jgi:hypothetical protein
MNNIDLKLTRKHRQELFRALQHHRGYGRLTERQKLVIDSFAEGKGYIATARALDVGIQRVHGMLRRQILPRYKATIWRQTSALSAALQILAKEAEVYSL